MAASWPVRTRSGPATFRTSNAPSMTSTPIPDQAGLSETIVVNELDRQENLVGSAEIVVTFEHSLFKRSDQPPHVPGSDRHRHCWARRRRTPASASCGPWRRTASLLAEERVPDDWYDDAAEDLLLSSASTPIQPVPGKASPPIARPAVASACRNMRLTGASRRHPEWLLHSDGRGIPQRDTTPRHDDLQLQRRKLLPRPDTAGHYA